jgi:hypothetical protein
MERPIQRIIPLYGAAFALRLGRPASRIRSLTGEDPVDFRRPRTDAASGCLHPRLRGVAGYRVKESGGRSRPV